LQTLAHFAAKASSEPKFDFRIEPFSERYLAGRGFLPNAIDDPADDLWQAIEADLCNARVLTISPFSH